MVIGIIYFIGFLLAFAMQRTECNANEVSYTKGLRVLCHILSLLSWAMVIYMLVAAWIEVIGNTGYWKKPVKEVTPKEEAK